MKLTQSNYRMTAVVGLVLALGTGFVLSQTDSANAANRGVDLSKMICVQEVLVEGDAIAVRDVNAAGEIVDTVAAARQLPTITVTTTFTVTKTLSSVIKTVTKTVSKITKTFTSFTTATEFITSIISPTSTNAAETPQCAG